MWKVSPPISMSMLKSAPMSKGGVNVDELEAAGVLDLAAERAGFERRENQFVVAPNEFIRPAFELASANIKPEFLVVSFFLSRFVNVFERLKRKNGSADFAGFPVPQKFDHRVCRQKG